MKVLRGKWGWISDSQVFRVWAVTPDLRCIVLECASMDARDIENAWRQLRQ